MKTNVSCGFRTLFLLLSFTWNRSVAAEPLLTVAESSDFTATMLYSDVIDFIDALQTRSGRIRVESLCTSTESRDVPLLVIGDPTPSSPHELKHDDRLVVYIQANIHAGEVEGKEASLMLARDILLANDTDVLDRLVILLAPIFNADGNEKLGPDNRRSQPGPESVGVRHNGQGLDINRDAMKIETPEMRGLVKNVLMRWDPALVVDCHTTNGSYHEEPVTYAWPLNPNGDSGIIAYMRDEMMPGIRKSMKKKYDVLSIPYGNFMDYENPGKGWQTFGHLTRYVTNYIGLRNRLAILDENYAYADYRTRVRGCYAFLRSILEYCHEHHEKIARLVREADEKSLRRFRDTPPDSFAVAFGVRALDRPVTVLGWDMELRPRDAGYPRVKKLDTRRTYTLPFYSDFYPVRSVAVPGAYLLPASAADAAGKLLLHGIIVQRLTRSVSLTVESFTLTGMESDDRLCQGHHLNRIEGTYAEEVLRFPEGTFFVDTAQPLGRLASALLEPESDDGLLVWNVFDRHLVSQWRGELQAVPVYRLLEPVPVAKRTISSEFE